ncbi:MAG: HNH endonuclease [Microbacteriaceae bacterium]|nr:HNH endonuclease [Microbacteriaceae bacterium]MCL2795745.1 HNH endonuclease [Microbacteriaceae bacterium]
MSTIGSAAGSALSRLASRLPVDPCVLTDLQLIGLAEDLAELSRLADGLRVGVAAEIDRRSDPDGESLAKRLGYKTPAQALEAIMKSSGKEAAKLVAGMKDLAKLPALEAAVLDGRVGLEAAGAIAHELKKAVGPGSFEGSGFLDGLGSGEGAADGGLLSAVEAELVELAATRPVDQVRERAQTLAVQLIPDAVEAQAEKAMRERYVSLSETRDGLARLSGLLPAGHAAVIRGVLDAFVNPRSQKTVAFADLDASAGVGGVGGIGDSVGAGSSSSLGDPVGSGVPGEPCDGRTLGQKRADLLRDVFASQARSAEAPDMGGDHPAVWVSVTASELAAGEGLAFYAGTPEAVPAREAVQAACAGGTQTVVFDEDGSVLRLGRQVRAFTRRQRRAIALRDGGSCVIPGCSIPAQWCEAHHVVAFRDGGRTDVDNGVLLCWFHHREIDSGPWRVRMRNGVPQVRYAWGGRVREWGPAGDGAASRLRPRAGVPDAASSGRAGP